MLAVSALPLAGPQDSVGSHYVQTNNHSDGYPQLKASTFDELVSNINRVLGPSNGIDSDGVDVQELVKLMQQYRSRSDDWSRFAFAGVPPHSHSLADVRLQRD
jgi:cysteine dioxygenase